MTPEQLDRLATYLEDNTLESLLEHFDMDSIEAVQALFENGFLDEELLEELI
mgnify:FL=1